MDYSDKPKSGGVGPQSIDITGVTFRPNLAPDVGGGGGAASSAPSNHDASTPTPTVSKPGADSQAREPISAPNVSVTGADSQAREIIMEAVKREYLYAMLGLILGISAIIGGIVLGLNGVAGSTSWTASLLGLNSKVNDAAPGVVLFIIGLFMVWATKPKVRMRDLRG